MNSPNNPATWRGAEGGFLVEAGAEDETAALIASTLANAALSCAARFTAETEAFLVSQLPEDGPENGE